MAKERILITVKTYPTLSTSYGELVCTAGLREDGTWVRIYPVPFRQLEDYRKFEKYRVIEANIIRNTKDPRPERCKVDIDSLCVTETKLPTKRDNWQARKNWVLHRGTVYEDLTELFDLAKQNVLSLATVKPAQVVDFKVEPQSPEWDQKKLDAVQQRSRQGDLFPEWEPVTLTKLVAKLPWKFSYKIRDVAGRESTMMIEDWEIGMLYWNCLKKPGTTPEEAVTKVRQKYFDVFKGQDLYLYLGTTRAWHGIAPNPFVVIGVFCPPYQPQMDLFTDV